MSLIAISENIVFTQRKEVPSCANRSVVCASDVDKQRRVLAHMKANKFSLFS